MPGQHQVDPSRPNGYGSRNRYQHGPLVSGSMDQNPTPSIFNFDPSRIQIRLEGQGSDPRTCGPKQPRSPENQQARGSLNLLKMVLSHGLNKRGPSKWGGCPPVAACNLHPKTGTLEQIPRGEKPKKTTKTWRTLSPRTMDGSDGCNTHTHNTRKPKRTGKIGKGQIGSPAENKGGFLLFMDEIHFAPT